MPNYHIWRLSVGGFFLKYSFLYEFVRLPDEGRASRSKRIAVSVNEQMMILGPRKLLKLKIISSVIPFPLSHHISYKLTVSQWNFHLTPCGKRVHYFPTSLPKSRHTCLPHWNEISSIHWMGSGVDKRVCPKTVLTIKLPVQPKAGTTSPAIHLVDKVHFCYKKGGMVRLLLFDPGMSKRTTRSESRAQRQYHILSSLFSSLVVQSIFQKTGRNICFCNRSGDNITGHA